MTLRLAWNPDRPRPCYCPQQEHTPFTHLLTPGTGQKGGWRADRSRPVCSHRHAPTLTVHWEGLPRRWVPADPGTPAAASVHPLSVLPPPLLPPTAAPWTREAERRDPAWPQQTGSPDRQLPATSMEREQRALCHCQQLTALHVGRRPLCPARCGRKRAWARCRGGLGSLLLSAWRHGAPRSDWAEQACFLRQASQPNSWGLGSPQIPGREPMTKP